MKPNLNKLLQLFLDQNIDFVVIGGIAAALHGSSMVTRDLDLCFVLTPENIDTLRNSLRELNPRLRITPKKLSFLDFPETNTGFKNLYLETDLGIVDIVSQVTGVGDFSVLLEQAQTVELFGHKCMVMSLEHLIKSKKAMGRPKDLAVVAELENTIPSEE
jgi:predicted nucleotidyltransferase